jgi:hypothetical protein
VRLLLGSHYVLLGASQMFDQIIRGERPAAKSA